MQTLRLRLQPVEHLPRSTPRKREQSKEPELSFEDRLFERFFQTYDYLLSHAVLSPAFIVIFCVLVLVFGLFVRMQAYRLMAKC